MKNEIETGVKNFIESAIRERDSLEPEDDLPIPVHAASSDDVIDEQNPYIVAQVVDAPQLVGGIGHAELNIIVSSPHATGYETDHRTWHRFLRIIFQAAVPPAMPANAAHLSEEVFAVTGETSVQGFHITGYPGSAAEGMQQDGISIKLGIFQGAKYSLVSEGSILVA